MGRGAPWHVLQERSLSQSNLPLCLIENCNTLQGCRDEMRSFRRESNNRMASMSDYRKFKEINDLFIHGYVEEGRRLLMELQARYIALHDELNALKKQVQEFDDILFLSQNLVPEGEHYWLRTGSIRHGPFCRSCYEYTGKLIRLEGHTNVWRCPYCGLPHKLEAAPRMVLAASNPLAQQSKIIPFQPAAKER
jgi:hypothetical protein